MKSRRTWSRSIRNFALLPGLVIVLLLAVSSDAHSQEFTPYDVAKLQYVGTLEISPNGEQIAYTRIVQRNPFENDGSAWDELHVVDTEGNSRPYITGEVDVSDIRWTPDGEAISFVDRRDDDDHRSLYTIPVDGGEASKVLEYGTNIREYSWSPDGNTVAFLAYQPKSEETVEREGQGFDQEIFEEDWRPAQVVIADLTGETVRTRVLPLDGSASELHWSPDGEHLVLALAPTSLIDDHYMYRRIKIVDVESGDIVTAIDNPGKLGEIAWSPDGQHIAFISGVDIHDPREGRLMLADISTGEFENILPDYEGHVSSVAWKNDNTILYLGDENGWTTYNQIRMNGTRQRTLIETGGPVIERFSVAANGTATAFDMEAPRHPDEVFYARNGTNAERLTNHNPWLADKQFGEQEVVSWTARDGLELYGILIKPVGYEDGEDYPLILSVHGGPESHDTNGWLTSYGDPGQVGASRGYAVLYPNYRGSTGRGVEFSKLSQNDPAGTEFEDLADAVDHFVETGLANEDQVGITGGSYGGYATAWCATYYSDRFAAGVMGFGISNKISKTGTSDIPWELYLVHDSTWPWEDWQHYLEASPIYHAEDAQTPLLITHGEEDTRVHPGQSLELYRFLKVIDNAPVRLVLYSNEGHGYGQAAHRLDHNIRSMRWMDHYLKGTDMTKPDYRLDYNSEMMEK